MSGVEASHGSVRIHSRYVRITPCSAAAEGSRSSRESSRSAALRTSSGSTIDCSRSRSSSNSARSGSLSPSSSWIAFSCWRRKNSRCPFSISDCTCDWIRVPSSKTSSSRFRMRETCRSRCSTLTSSSSSCFSSVFSRSVDATRWQSALGSSTFAAASSSSSGRYGTSAMIRANSACTLRVSASTSGVSSSTSGHLDEPAHEVGLDLHRRFEPDPADALHEHRSVPSGTRIILWITAAVPTS